MDCIVIAVSRGINVHDLAFSVTGATLVDPNRFLIDEGGQRAWIQLGDDVSADYAPNELAELRKQVESPRFIVIESNSDGLRRRIARDMVRLLRCVVDLDRADGVLVTGDDYLTAG